MAPGIAYDNLQAFVLQCGSIHESRRFCTNILDQLSAVVPFDQGRIYFLNENMSIFDEYLLGVAPRVSREYRERYSKLEKGKYSIPNRHQLSKGIPDCVDWASSSLSGPFVREHLQPQKIRCSTGIHLPDLYGTPRALFCLDRISKANYTVEEIQTLDLLQKHLTNLYQNFFADKPPTQCGFSQAISTKLTKREREVLALLMQGLSSQQVSDQIFISKATVIKHISHIYQKLHVTSRAELFAYVLKESRHQDNGELACIPPDIMPSVQRECGI